jgi:hypothetical protein
VLDRDDDSPYLENATDNLAALIEDLAGATCICCLKHPVVTMQTDTTRTTRLSYVRSVDAMLWSQPPSSRTERLWKHGMRRDFRRYSSTDRRMNAVSNFVWSIMLRVALSTVEYCTTRKRLPNTGKKKPRHELQMQPLPYASVDRNVRASHREHVQRWKILYATTA